MHRQHHLSEEEITLWVMMVIFFVITLIAGYLFWLKLAMD